MNWIRDASGTTQYAVVVDGEAVGGIGYLVGSDVYLRSAEIGFWLGHACWGQGIMSEGGRGADPSSVRTTRPDTDLRRGLRVEPGLDASPGKGRVSLRGTFATVGDEGR